MRCFKCGADLPPESRYCSECGEYQGFSAELIERAKNGDQDAMTELYMRTHNNVYHTVKALIQSDDTVLDIVQDSYVKGFHNLSQLQDPDKFRAWMKRIAHNLAVDYLRKARPVMFSALSTEDHEVVEFADDRTENLPDVVMDQQETTRLVNEILGCLSEEQRLVVSMYYYEQMSVKEIAELLGISENTVKSRLSYGRRKIEVQVRALEKKGTKLYSLAPLPFLLLLFKNLDAQTVAPNAAALQAIQQACASGTASSAAGTAAGGAQAGAKAAVGAGAKAAAGAASKGVAAKIIAGVIAVAVIGGGAAGIAVLRQKEQPETEQPQTVQEAEEQPETPEPKPPEEPQEPQPVSAEELYQPILEEYGTAMAQGTLEAGEFPNINEVMMSVYYYPYGGSFYYDCYDMDGNGTEELLIGYGTDTEPVRMVDLYGVQGQEVYKLIDDDTLGERTQASIYPDGSLVLTGSAGYDSVSLVRFQFQADGTLGSPETILDGATSFSSLGKTLDELLAEHLGDQQPVETFDWQPIDPIWETESSEKALEYLGIYMNGQDWNAGRLTIEETDAGSVTVRLETFKNQSDQALSTIFEGIGQATADGLVVDVSGQQVLLRRSSIGLALEPAPSLLAEWALDPYVFEQEYYFVGLPESVTAKASTGNVDIRQYDGYCCYDENHLRYRLDTADGNLTLMFYARSGSPEYDQGYYEDPYSMNLDTAEISGGIYTIYNVSNLEGTDVSDKFYSIQFLFEEDRVLMVVSADPTKLAGGADDNILSGTYVFTKD